MSDIGDIKRAKDLGLQGYHKYIYANCSVCGNPRWVVTKWGKPSTDVCLKCYHDKPEVKYNWRGDKAHENSGRMRALRHIRCQPCRICGNKGEHHHIDGNTLNNELTNIDYLCRRHHMEIDGRIPKAQLKTWGIEDKEVRR